MFDFSKKFTVSNTDLIYRDLEEGPSSFLIARGVNPDCLIQNSFGHRMPDLDDFNRQFDDNSLEFGSVIVESFRDRTGVKQIYQTRLDYSSTENLMKSIYSAGHLTLKDIIDKRIATEILFYLMSTTMKNGLKDKDSALSIYKVVYDTLTNDADVSVKLRIKDEDARTAVNEIKRDKLYENVPLLNNLKVTARLIEGENYIAPVNHSIAKIGVQEKHPLDADYMAKVIKGFEPQP